MQTLQLPEAHVRLIMGARGAQHRHLQQALGVTIVAGKRGPTQEVCITGQHVDEAVRWIKRIVDYKNVWVTANHEEKLFIDASVLYRLAFPPEWTFFHVRLLAKRLASLKCVVFFPMHEDPALPALAIRAMSALFQKANVECRFCAGNLPDTLAYEAFNEKASVVSASRLMFDYRLDNKPLGLKVYGAMRVGDDVKLTEHRLHALYHVLAPEPLHHLEPSVHMDAMDEKVVIPPVFCTVPEEYRNDVASKWYYLWLFPDSWHVNDKIYASYHWCKSTGHSFADDLDTL